MKKILAILCPLIAGYSCLAQEEQKPVLHSTNEIIRRYSMTTPPYGLEKVEKIVHTDSAKEKYEALSLREKYTYNMIYGETYSQNCSGSYTYRDGDADKKIFGFLPLLFFERTWSDRQLAFFKNNKDSVIAFMAKDIRDQKVMGLNCKHVIVDIDAVSMIPLLISVYKLQKDHDILTVLMLLMKRDNYAPFMSSVDYNKVYAGTEKSYETALEFNAANEAFVIRQATDFYHGLSK